MSLNSMRESFHASGKWLLGLVTIAMLFLSYSGIGSIFGQRKAAQSSQAPAASDTVATVNGEPITRRVYDKDYSDAKQMQQMYQQGASGVLSDGQSKSQALQTAIHDQELVIAAQNAGVTATSADLDKARNGQLVDMRTELGLPASASVDDINTALSKYSSQTVNELIPDSGLRNDVLKQKYQQQLTASSMPTAVDMDNYYKSVHTRHILISNKTRPDAQALNQAQQIIAKIKAGGDFAALAKQYSDDTVTKIKGGDDGFVDASTGYATDFMNAAYALKAGQTTPQPVLSPEFGYFIIQTLAVKDTHPADFQKNKANYQQQVAQSMESKAEQSAIAQVATTAKVDVKDPLLRAFYAFSQPVAPGQTRATQEASIVADLNQALPSASYSDKALIYAVLALQAKQKNDIKGQIADLNNAVDASSNDAQLHMMLGDAYRTSGDAKSALAQYALASDNSYNSPSVHMQLQQTYTAMKQPLLAAKEAQLERQIAQAQQQSQPQLPAGFGGAGAGAVPVQAGQSRTVALTAPKAAAKNAPRQ